MAAQPNPRLGSYELLERLGQGGMAEVFRARYRGAAGTQREVVIKRILPFAEEEKSTLEALFVSEARLTLQLTHGNVVQVFDFGEEAGQYYLVMELVDGVSLAQLLTLLAGKGVPGLPPSLAALVMIEVAKGLHYAHLRCDTEGRPLHIVHRDISPDNVLLGFDGQVKVADFGIARASLAGRAKTEPGIFRGKLAYSAPEQLRADPVDGRADVYSCGIVLWKCITGKNPQGELGFKLAAGRAVLPQAPVAAMGEALAEIVTLATALEAEERTPSAQQLQVQLQTWVRQQPVPSPDTAIAQLVAWATRGSEAVDPAFDAWLQAVAREAPRVAPPARELVSTVHHKPASTRGSAPAPAKESTRIHPLLVLAAAVGILGLCGGLLALASGSNASDDQSALRPLDLKTPAPAPARLPTPAPTPSIAPPVEAKAPDAPTLPRAATGAPARFVLSTTIHGIDMASVGLKVDGPARNWALRLQGMRKLSLYFLPLVDDDERAPLIVGSQWVRTDARRGRLFIFQPPGWTTDQGNPDLHVGSVTGAAIASGPMRPRVLSESMVFLDERRFRLDGLDPNERYRLATHALEGAPAVFVVAEAPADSRTRLKTGEPRLSIPGPPRQALVPAGGSLEIRGVVALLVAMPSFAGVPERRVEVTVTSANGSSSGIVVERGSAEARAMDANLRTVAAPPPNRVSPRDEPVMGNMFSSSTAEGNLNTATMLIGQHREREAVPFLERCLSLDPGNPECLMMLRRVREK